MSLPTLAPKYSFDGSSIHRSSQAGSKRQMNGSVVSSHAEERQTIGKMSKASKHSTAAGTESVRLNHLHDPEMSSIVAFVENKQREVGVAVIFLKRPIMVVSQFKDHTTYGNLRAMLEQVMMLEVLCPDTLTDSNAVKEVSSRFCQPTFVKRKYFNENNGIEHAKRLVTQECAPALLECSGMYLAMSALSAAVQYVEFVQQINFAAASLTLIVKSPLGTIHMDISTIRNLELVRNIRSGDWKHSLMGYMNHCKTTMGSRLLRASILQPMQSGSNADKLNARLDAVELILQNEELFFGVSKFLGMLPDIEHIVTSCLVHVPKIQSLARYQHIITSMLQLKAALHVVQNIATLLLDKNCENVQRVEETSTLMPDKASNFSSDVCSEGPAVKGPISGILRSIASVLNRQEIISLLTIIAETLTEDAVPEKNVLKMQTQRCFAVNPSVDPLLDVARQTYADVTSDIHDTASKYQQVYPSFNIRLVHNSKRGYHLMMKTSEELNMQSFILVSTKGGNIFFSTEELESLNQKCNEAVNEIYIITGRVLEELIGKLRPYIGILNSLADSLALLDLLQSYASMVTLSNGMLTRPQFNSAGAIAIEKGRHPLETMVTPEQFIPNDCFLTEECCMKILHGPNMSGKSTYLRQVALLTIMAHTGSFVPAVRSSFGNIDRIFTRIGTNDDMEANASTFMLEMVEVQNILQNCTCQSLAIIDELGRGTSSSDGVGIAWSVSEYLIGTGVLTLFATHFLQLLQLENIYIQCKVMFLQYDVSSKDIQYRYIMKEGRKEDDGYGIKTARAAGFPESVLADAEKSRSAVMRFNGELQSAHAGKQATSKRQLQVNIGMRLRHLISSSSLPEETLWKLLVSLKNQYKTLMEELSVPL